jgi:capsular polysaccharide biosynthesis protein
MTKQRLNTVTGCLFALILVSGILFSGRAGAADKVYVASVRMVAQESPDFHVKYPKSSARWLDQGPDAIALVVTSERVLQSAARELTLFNITLAPESLLSTVKVEPIPGSRAVKLEVTSTDPKEAKEAVEAIAKEGQRVYFEGMNRESAHESDKDVLKLKILGPVRVTPAPGRGLAIAAPLGGALGAIVLIAVGVMVGLAAKGARQGGKSSLLSKAVIAVLALTLVASCVLYAKIWRAPQLYVGRVKLTVHLSPQDALRPNAVASLEAWARTALNKGVMNDAARTLTLFNITKTPEDLLSTAVMERIPDTRILKLEVTSSDSDDAEASADALVSELARAYRLQHNPSGNTGRDATGIRIYEEAHVYPVNSHKLASPSGFVAAGSLLFLLGALGGALGGRRVGYPE